MATNRPVTQVLAAVRTVEGAGFVVRRPFPTATLDHFDPFLLLDHMGPVELAPGEAKGAPDHPHRGFETVTYILEGELEHEDSLGNRGALRSGDVQWMTAGDGVIHSEMPSARLIREGGRLHGFQLWVNLPRRDKRMRPRYQDVAAGTIPVGTSPDGLATVRVIAGEALGAKAVIETRTPIAYLHFTLQPGAEIRQPLSPDLRGFAYVFGGEAQLGGDGQPVREGQAALLGDGDEVSLAVAADAAGPADLLLIAGMPLREPVARMGPFVMNTRRELIEAVEDFQRGTFGKIAPLHGP